MGNELELGGSEGEVEVHGSVKCPSTCKESVGLCGHKSTDEPI